MCHFISCLIEKTTQIDTINRLGIDYSILFDRCDNDFVKSQLNANEEYMIKTTNSCECGTYLGLITRSQIPGARIEKSEMDKLKKKGWGQTKINRWVVERSKALEKDKIRYDKLVNDDHPDILNWIQYLNMLFTETTISHVGLLLHCIRVD